MIDIQLVMLYLSLINGALMGLSYDVIRLTRRIIRHNNFFVGLEDLIFWLLWAFVVIDEIHLHNSGELRIYIYFGILIGVIIYKNTIGWAFNKLLSHILYFAKKHEKKDK